MIDTPYLGLDARSDFGGRFSNNKFSATLKASTDESLTVPPGSPRYKAIMRSESDGQVYVALNQTAELPAGTSFASTGSEMMPQTNDMCREVEAGDVLHFITSKSNIDVCVIFYALPR